MYYTALRKRNWLIPDSPHPYKTIAIHNKALEKEMAFSKTSYKGILWYYGMYQGCYITKIKLKNLLLRLKKKGGGLKISECPYSVMPGNTLELYKLPYGSEWVTGLDLQIFSKRFRTLSPTYKQMGKITRRWVFVLSSSLYSKNYSCM